jgi:deoxyribonuclease-4
MIFITMISWLQKMNKVYDVCWDIGAHTAFAGKICDTLWTSVNYGMYATQFFMGNPQGFDRAKISFEDIAQSKKILSRYPMHVFSHFPYVANFAGSVSSLAWNGDDAQDRKTLHILKSLEYELSVLSNFKNPEISSGVVIHPGSFKDREKGLSAISTSINKINFSNDAKLILENASGQGTALATTFHELKTIIDGVDKSKQRNVGVCIDTCHTFAYGDYDLSEIKEVDRLFKDFDDIIGLDRFTLLHLNDSETRLKGKTDRHACLGTGHIWGKDFESLKYLLDKCKFHNIPAVLETHGIDMITLAIIGNKF